MFQLLIIKEILSIFRPMSDSFGPHGVLQIGHIVVINRILVVAEPSPHLVVCCLVILTARVL